MTIIENLKKQIEVFKKLIRLHQLILAIKKNEPEPDKEEIWEYIRIKTLEYNINYGLAFEVAKCESGFKPFAINFNRNGSYDRGLYQINDRWHPEMSDEDCFNYKKSIEFFCQAVKAGHLNWWNASRTCWSK
jgi:hypothetical protein